MESPSNLKSLSQTLALKKAQDSAVVAESTSAELKKLGTDLQRQSSAVLTTTALSITQTAAREMQNAGLQLSPQIEQIRKDLSEQLTQAQQQIEQQLQPLDSVEIKRQLDAIQEVIDQRLQTMQDQIEQQLQPLDDAQLKQRMNKLEGQINAQIKPLLAALDRVKTESEALSLMTAKAWLKPVLISLAILASISLPAWGLMHYTATRIQSNLEQIEQQNLTLRQIQASTWGIEFLQNYQGQFLILPEGTKAEVGGTLGGRQAVKLLKN